MGSNNHHPRRPEAVRVDLNDEPAVMQSELLNPPKSEHATALAVIIVAFVDLGFGSSATKQTLRAANDNRRLVTLADDFRRNTI